MEHKGKSKVTGLKAKRSLSSVSGKDPKKVITGNRLKSSGLSTFREQGNTTRMKAKNHK